MSFPPPPAVDIRASPAGFDALIDWLEAWSYRLVLLEEYPLPDVRAAVEAVERAVTGHRGEFEARLDRVDLADWDTSRLVRILRSDHEWFGISLEQLRWFLDVVETEDHGGHRQALGQFGRVFAEALRRHRTDEGRLFSISGERPSRTMPGSRETLINSAERARQVPHA
jgi:hypothetical protein